MSSNVESASEDSLRAKVLRALERSPYEPYTGSLERPAAPRTDVTKSGFSGKRAAEIVGISYRQLDYWARTDLVRPSLSDDNDDTRARFSYRDLIELKLVKTLLDHGIKLESIRAAFDYLRDELEGDLPSARLVIAGRSAVLVRENEDLMDVVNRYSGQGVFNLNLIDLDGVRDEIDAALDESGEFAPDHASETDTVTKS
jgi:DNA-binding transcriptional MerR regulator